MSRRVVPIVLYAAALGLLVLVPWVMGEYTVATLSRVLIFAVLAMSVNLLTGTAGMPTLGQSAYFGVGAYTGALVGINVTDWSPAQLIIATLAGAVAALVTGFVAVRGRGVVFLMITLAIGEIAYSAAGRLEGVTRGTDGLSGVPPVVFLPGGKGTVNEGLVYYYVLAAFVVTYLLIQVLLRSPFGLTLRGLRDNEARLRAIGYRTTAYALAVYVVAGAIAGAAGSLWASAGRFVAPGDMGFEVAALALLAAIIGGLGSMWGACLGAALVVLTRDYLGGMVAGRGPLLLGILFVLTVYLLPGGIAGVRDQVGRSRRRRGTVAP
ncbi:MAG: branched-chain amino acid ABC transporter permease [Humibacillus sp.]